MEKIIKVYKALLKKYGPQGWWPINGKYHPGDYSFPKTENQRFEICVGAILTQNTSWKNVEKALVNLRKAKILQPSKIMSLSILKKLINPSGYFNQKSEYVKNFTRFFLSLKGIPTRIQLLSVKGIGPETADSILLYAYNQPEFIVDAYTKRVLLSKDLIRKNASYHEIKELFEKNLPKDYKIFQEFHALLVEHAKNFSVIPKLRHNTKLGHC